MGSFYVNFTVRGADQADVARFLRSADRRAYVSPTLSGMTVFYDEQSDEQDVEAAQSLAERLSKELAVPVLAVLNHDDDILMYWLFDSGTLCDVYDSCPGYFEDGPGNTPNGGDVIELCTAFDARPRMKQVAATLQRTDFSFALLRHMELAKLLGIPETLITVGYKSIVAGELPEGLSSKDQLQIK